MEHRKLFLFVTGVQLAAALVLGLDCGRVVAAQQAPVPDAGMHTGFSQLLDLYVRDGLVYYRALQGDRAKLDRYIASLDLSPATYESWPREEQIAFWINAYNALVLKTVLDRYPIRGRSADYPVNSIRQIPGAFEQTRHRVAGRSVTLDEIDKTILPSFGDPRVFLALGRGAVGSGRLRSEAFSGKRLEDQLKSVAAETATRERLVKVDMLSTTLSVSPIFSWHEKDFVTAYAAGNPAGPSFASRSPIERAVLVLIEPHLFPMEREFVTRNEFRMTFQSFDWRLNDLTGGRVD